MSADTDRLREMINDSESEAEDLANSISQIEDIRDDTNDKISAVENGMCAVAETSAIDIIDNTIAIDKGGYAEYGSQFGIIQYSPAGNLTDFVIKDSTSDAVVYVYLLGDYPDLDVLVADYAFGNDYLTRPLESGATYGLIPYKDNLNSAISILTNNKTKVENSASFLEDYAS